MTERHDWQPNGSRYDLVYTPDLGDGYFLLTWLCHGGSGGVSLRARRGSYLSLDYLMPKMRLDSEADAHALVAFLVAQGAVTGQGEVWYTTAPRDYDYWHTLDLGTVEMGHRRVYATDKARFEACQIPRYASGMHRADREEVTRG